MLCQNIPQRGLVPFSYTNHHPKVETLSNCGKLIEKQNSINLHCLL